MKKESCVMRKLAAGRQVQHIMDGKWSRPYAKQT